MSNRLIGNDSKNTPKPQQKYTPKRDSQNPDPRNTLSNSLRAATSTVRMGEDGEWVSKVSTSGNFVTYLPQDDAVAAGLGPEEGGLDPVESQRVVDMLNRELSRLLKLRPRDFWREVATDESMHALLESFLKFRSRWYDFPHRGVRGIVAGVIVGEFELCRRVFMVLYRISSSRDPGAKAADSLSSKEHEERGYLLQDKKLLDLPKLLDICAIFGYENEDLTRVLVMNALKAQPDIELGFTVLLSHFLSIVQTMFQRCSASLEVLLGSGSHQDLGSSRLHLDYLEVMDFINDSVVSLDSFVNAYKHAAVFFSSPVEMGYGNEELLVMLARLHDLLLPSLHRGFHILLGVAPVKNKDLLSNVFTSLKMLSTRIAKLGWKLLYYCYLSDEAFGSSIYSHPASMKMFPATLDDPAVRADILIQMVRDLNSEHKHVVGEPTWGTFIQDIEKNFKMTSRIELLQNTGWLSLDDEQYKWLSAITMTQPHFADTKKASTATSLPAATTTKSHTDEDAAIIESKISQIKELFPDYGRRFLIACLEAYNHDPEEVIQRILEGTLHKELQSLDSSLETIPPPKPASLVITNSRDKGKGKLVEPPVMGPTVERTQSTVISSGSSSSSSFGRFVRKNTNDLSDSETLNAQKDKELTKTAALASQLEYEDEYDDSFDDLGLSVGDSGLDEPDDKMSSRRADNDGSSLKAADSLKWGSRKKPQFYVKDGKNYSYKVDGSVVVSNYNEAQIVNQAQREQIHGLGRGGNLPMGAVRRLTELNADRNDELLQGGDGGEAGRRGRGGGGGRGRGRRGFYSSSSGEVRVSEESNEGQEEGGENNDDEVGGRGRGGGRRGGSRGRRGNNNYRKARAMSKQLTGLPAHYR
ncbi:hypothetical protein CASFOL_028092 [Castilleja foliolosa]|uniref:CUE domain-containing protein n=1 Tax=Castilleja foliolosa TaxID=1961234 RepID=A0ABD3CDL1_9LAMI